MSTPNPMESTVQNAPRVSSKTHVISGIRTTIHGLSELPSGCSQISCLWLLHPRLGSAKAMEPLASTFVQHHNRRRPPSSRRGLICVTFDQRNHGTRLQSGLANEAWRQGNPLHAQDMYSIYAGTAGDLSALLSFLPAYVFPAAKPDPVDQNLVLGISLGGHSAWQVLFGEPRIGAAIVVVGCPDYVSLMSDRARLSKLESWMRDGGRTFVGSKDFPEALVEETARSDPRGIIFGGRGGHEARDEERRERLRKRLGGKRLLNLAGKEDKLVPYRCGEEFLGWLKGAAEERDLRIVVEDKVFEGVGHEMSPGMLKEAIRFVEETIDLAASGGEARKRSRSSL